MINWILKRKFVQEYIATLKPEWIREASIDAFTKAIKDLEETNVYDIDTKAQELATQKLQSLLSVIDWNKVLKVNHKTKQLYVGEVMVDANRLSNLKAEANFLLESDIWNLLCETPKAEAQSSMFIKGETLDDMKKGKIMLFVLDQQRQILETIQKLST